MVCNPACKPMQLHGMTNDERSEHKYDDPVGPGAKRVLYRKNPQRTSIANAKREVAGIGMFSENHHAAVQRKIPRVRMPTTVTPSNGGDRTDTAKNKGPSQTPDQLHALPPGQSSPMLPSKPVSLEHFSNPRESNYKPPQSVEISRHDFGFTSYRTGLL